MAATDAQSAEANPPSSSARRVVVLGGGIAGVVTATHLARRLRGTQRAEMLLIDHNFAHVWKPMLRTFAAGTANYSTQSISFAPHAKRNGYKYWPGDLCGVDREHKMVELGAIKLPDGASKLPGRQISYDILIPGDRESFQRFRHAGRPGTSLFYRCR
jgi:NADH:ubiquinone reductase (H+-translocating)